MLIFHFMNMKTILLARITKKRGTSFSLMIAYVFTTNRCIKREFSLLQLSFIWEILGNFPQFRFVDQK